MQNYLATSQSTKFICIAHFSNNTIGNALHYKNTKMYKVTKDTTQSAIEKTLHFIKCHHYNIHLVSIGLTIDTT